MANICGVVISVGVLLSLTFAQSNTTIANTTNTTLNSNISATNSNAVMNANITTASATPKLSSANINTAYTTAAIITTTTVKPTKPHAEVTVYSDRERAALDKFRALLATTGLPLHDYQQQDNYLIRWLRARNLDVDLANRMLTTSQRWRKHNRIDTILNETIATFNPLPYKIGGLSYEGNPLIMFTPTSLDLRRLLINGKNISRYWDQILEEASLRVREYANMTGKPTTQVISLMDLSGFNLRQHGCIACFGTYIDWITDYELYFPQLAKHIVWINSPRVFVAVLELVKPLMSPATSKALRVFGTNKPEWSAYLQKLIPKDQLTFRFGGAKKV